MLEYDQTIQKNKDLENISLGLMVPNTKRMVVDYQISLPSQPAVIINWIISKKSFVGIMAAKNIGEIPGRHRR